MRTKERVVHLMAITYQWRGDRCRAIIRRPGHKTQTKTFSTKSLAKTWADRIERELEERDARGGAALDAAPLSEVITWFKDVVGRMKRITGTHKGNLTRLTEGLGATIAGRLSSADVIEHVRRRRQGEHVNGKGVRIPACGPATMTVELGYLAEVLKTAQAMSVLTLLRDPVAEARLTLRNLKLIAKSKKRTRRPNSAEIDALHTYFNAIAWRAQIPMNDIIDFAIATAKREGEITRLLKSDIDATTRTALLRDAKHPRSKEGNHRRFALLADAWTIAQRQPVVDGEDRLFPYNSKSVGTAFTRACQSLKIVDLHFHDLRHEGTSRLFEQGYTIEQVASVTLHESWADLKRYTQLKPESLHRD